MSLIESSSLAQIRAAIEGVQDNRRDNRTIQPGLTVLSKFLAAPKYTLSYDELISLVGKELTWRFGWFCERVAGKLGDADPPMYALTDRCYGEDGKVVLTLKSRIVAALTDDLS